MWLEKKAFYYLRKESRIMGFIDVIKERAKANKKTIVLPETEGTAEPMKLLHRS